MATANMNAGWPDDKPEKREYMLVLGPTGLVDPMRPAFGKCRPGYHKCSDCLGWGQYAEIHAGEEGKMRGITTTVCPVCEGRGEVPDYLSDP